MGEPAARRGVAYKEEGCLQGVAVDSGFGKKGFMRMCTVATTPPFYAHAHRCNESGCCCFNSLHLFKRGFQWKPSGSGTGEGGLGCTAGMVGGAAQRAAQQGGWVGLHSREGGWGCTAGRVGGRGSSLFLSLDCILPSPCPPAPRFLPLLPPLPLIPFSYLQIVIIGPDHFLGVRFCACRLGIGMGQASLLCIAVLAYFSR